MRSGPCVDGKSHQNDVGLGELEQNEKAPELGKTYINYLAYLLCSLWADFCKPSFSRGKDSSPFPSGDKKILSYCSNSEFFKPWAHV